MRVLTVGVLIFCAPALVRPLAAEELLVQGMGRTVGWVVATSDGKLAFRDCGGRLLSVRGGRIERAKRICPAVVPQNLIRRIHDNLRASLRIRQIDVDVAGMASRMATKAPRAQPMQIGR